MKNNLLIILVFMVFSLCNAQTDISKWVKTPATVTPKKSKLTDEDLKYWWHKDIIDDSIPRISLDKAYKLLLKNNQSYKILQKLQY